MPLSESFDTKKYKTEAEENGAEPRLTRNMKRRPPVIPNGSGMTPPKE